MLSTLFIFCRWFEMPKKITAKSGKRQALDAALEALHLSRKIGHRRGRRPQPHIVVSFTRNEKKNNVCIL